MKRLRYLVGTMLIGVGATVQAAGRTVRGVAAGVHPMHRTNAELDGQLTSDVPRRRAS